MVLIVGFATALVLAQPVRAAAPNYIRVSGPGLARPVLLADWSENLVLFLALNDARKASGASLHRLARRPGLDLAEFWGWSGLPRPATATKTEYHQRFYPAHGRQPAISVRVVNGITSPPCLVPPAVLRIFARHRIPLRL
jgi:hypothetical protein